MESKNILFDFLKSIAVFLLSPKVYIRFAKLAYPLFNSSRRWPKFKISKLGKKLYSIEYMENSPFFFYEHTRIDRYLFPEAYNTRMKLMLDKYSYNKANISIKKGDIVIEVGANIGEFSIPAASLASKIVCIEPDPIPFNCLKMNLINFKNVFLFNLACSDLTGKIDFYLSSKGADSSMIKPDSYEKKVTLDSKPLDRILEELKIDKIDFLKIEAEGAEPEVLKGASKTLTMTKKIAVDCSPEREGTSTRDSVIATLKKNGFEIHEKNDMIYGIKHTTSLVMDQKN